MKNQSGFTLIELVIVIVLLGVLSAIAVPRFVNLEDDAQRASLNSTAAALTSAMNINYAACAVAGHVASASGDCRAVSTCEGATGALQVVQGGALSGYTITPATIDAGNGTTASCQITKNGYTGAGSPATFTAVRAGT
jgi:MSHA pilin protein MshA